MRDSRGGWTKSECFYPNVLYLLGWSCAKAILIEAFPRSRSRRFSNPYQSFDQNSVYVHTHFSFTPLHSPITPFVIRITHTPYRFQSIAQSESLTDIDLVFIEEAFERLLLDYDRVFSAMAIPACLWRRTGEIYKANREFAELVGVDGYMLRDVRDLPSGRVTPSLLGRMLI